jgi:hypothetical protein
MLERVGHPQIINPDPRLKAWAQLHDLDWEHWHAQGVIQAGEHSGSGAAQERA